MPLDNHNSEEFKYSQSSHPLPYFLINEKETAPVGADKCVVVVIMEPFRSYCWDSAKAR